MSAERRAALVAWAVASGGLVVEDDYDAEYRYDREPIGAVQGLAPEHVLYAGSASKTLAPGLRLGWLICPARLVEPHRGRQGGERSRVGRCSSSSPSPTSSSAASSIAISAACDRSTVDGAMPCSTGFGGTCRRSVPVGASAGLHVAAWLPADVDEAALVASATALGVRVSGLTRYHFDRRRGSAPGCCSGTADSSEVEIGEGTRLVREALAAL